MDFTFEVSTPEDAALAALLEEVQRIAEASPDRASVECQFDREVAVRLGLSTEPFIETWSTVPGARVLISYGFTWHALAYAAEAMLSAAEFEADGDDESAELARRHAILAGRDALRGKVSEELRLTQGDVDGGGIVQVPAMSPEEYDAHCRSVGNIEIGDRFEFRAPRRHRGGGNPPRRLRAVSRRPRGTRPRERRSRRSSRSSSGAKPRPQDDPDHDHLAPVVGGRR